MSWLALFLLLFNARTIEAVRVTEPPVIDGVLDEACWQENAGVSDFIEKHPDLGDEPSESTRVVVLYDERAVYFGCFCYDSEPEEVLARLVPRESSGDGDDITIYLDTYNDDRNAFYFSVNPMGLQRDVHITGGGRGWDRSWNGVWYSEGSITDWGWCAEIAIPFKTLRFPAASEQVWGLEITRWITRKQEMLAWADYEEGDRGLRIDRFGELRGIRGVKSGLHLEFLPHLTQTARLEAPRLFDSVSFVPFENGVAGMDFKWVMRSNLALDVTVLPDYGQIEADPEEINLGRYERYLRERRPFFTEGADLFRFRSFHPVYTRRIGTKLPDGSEVPIYAGAKFTGKIGRTEVGVIEVCTGEATYDYYDGDSYTEPAAVYSIARLKRDMFSRSDVGLIATSRERFGDASQGDRVVGADLDFAFADDWYVNGEGLYSFHTYKDGGPMGIVGFGKSGRLHFNTSVSYSDSLADLSAVGYLERAGHEWASLNVGYSDSWGEGLLRSLSLNVSPSAGKYLEDSLLSYSFWGFMWGSFANNWSMNLNGSLSHSYYQEDNTLRWTKSFGAGAASDETRDLSGGLSFQASDQYIYESYVPQYFGHLVTATPEVSLRPAHNAVISAYATMFFTFRESWELDPDNALRWTAGERVLYTATRHLSFRLNAQQNTNSEYYSHQLLATWEIAPLSFLYLAR